MNMKKKENRSVRVSGRIKPSLMKRVERIIAEEDYSLSDCIALGLVRLVSDYD